MFDEIAMIIQRSSPHLLQDCVGAVALVVLLVVGLNLPVVT